MSFGKNKRQWVDANLLYSSWSDDMQSSNFHKIESLDLECIAYNVYIISITKIQTNTSAQDYSYRKIMSRIGFKDMPNRKHRKSHGCHWK